MNEVSVRARLIECLHVVFPDVNEEQLSALSASTDSRWDSVAQVTLISLVEEEFGIQLPEEQYGELTSFRSLLAYLEARA